MNSAFAFKGGQPITIYNDNDTSGTNEYTQRVNQISNPFAGSHAQDPDQLDGGKVCAVAQPQCICRARRTTPGEPIARNSLFGPGYEDFDLSVFKNTKFDDPRFPGERPIPRRNVSTCSTA